MLHGNRTREILSRRIVDGRVSSDERVGILVDAIRRRHGAAVKAVILYGSYLRGERDTLLDFYVLLDSYKGVLPRFWHAWANRALPPNVYYLHEPSGAGQARAKYATVRLDCFEAAMSRLLDVSFWARFAQPCLLVYSRELSTRERIVDALCGAAGTFMRHALPMVPDSFTAKDLWAGGFGLTYGCELRAEQAGRGLNLFDANAEHFTALTDALTRDGHLPMIPSRQASDYRNPTTPGERRRARGLWRLRRWWGKAFSAFRLFKAAATFDDPLDYVLWKINRHAGVRVEPSERQRRHPLTLGWGLLWRIYRQGGFR
ncbi:MAG: hypothetical protein ABFS23_01485 [Pseudomonadota bacterium]